MSSELEYPIVDYFDNYYEEPFTASFIKSILKITPDFKFKLFDTSILVSAILGTSNVWVKLPANLDVVGSNPLSGVFGALDGLVFTAGSLNGVIDLSTYSWYGDDTANNFNYGTLNQLQGFTQNIYLAGGDDRASNGYLNGIIDGGSGNDTLNGYQGDDQLIGGSGDDKLYGGIGEDVLDGGSGADTLDGGEGNDRYILGSDTSDTIVDASGNDTITSTVTRSLAGYTTIEDLKLEGTSKINGTGNALNNTIWGNAAANVLKGANGNDYIYAVGGGDTLNGDNGNDYLFAFGGSILNGGNGNDTLLGTTGSDKFIFNTALNGSSNKDTILNFDSQDVIQLENSIFTALVGTGTLSANQFVIASPGKSLDADDRIIYQPAGSNGLLSYDPDGNGSASAITFALLAGGAAPSSSDFVII